MRLHILLFLHLISNSFKSCNLASFPEFQRSFKSPVNFTSYQHVIEFLRNTVTPVDYMSYESKTGRTIKLLCDVITVAFITFYHNVKFAIKAESLRNVPQLRSKVGRGSSLLQKR